jgi:hypothetical protein
MTFIMKPTGNRFCSSVFRSIFIVALFVVAGCSSVPLATEQENQAAKNFQSSSDHAIVFVFRDQMLMGAGVTTPFFLDGKLIGGINDFTFRRLDVAPGEHELGASSNTGAFASLSIKAEASQIYFVRLTGWPRMSLVNADEGQRQVQKCELVQP